MKKKILSILGIILLITSIFLPVSGHLIPYEVSYEKIIELGKTNDKVLTVDTIIDDQNVKYWEHVINGFTVKGDFILLHSTLDNKETLSFKKVWTRIDLPRIDTKITSFEPVDYFWKQKVIFPSKNDCSNFYTIFDQHDYPLLCWEVRHTDGTTKLYDLDGEIIGGGIPAPYHGFSLSGWVMPSDPDNYKEFRENADYWFKAWCTSTNSISLPTPSTISSLVSNPQVEYFYAMAHGNQQYFQADNPGSYYYASNVKMDMVNREPIRFAFIGTCQSMTEIGPNTFSYEFRKGKMTETVTIGFDHMETCPGWAFEYYWQNSLFENTTKGLTIKEAFDKATARYPTIEPAVVFLGDENLKIPLSDLQCDGEITWNDIPPEDTITDSFTVTNSGDTFSVLSWKINDYPNWGIWEFSPSHGEGIYSGDDPITVKLSVVIPNEQNTELDGEITIINSYNDEDTCVIPITITTPKIRMIHSPFLSILKTFLQTPAQLFPRLSNLLS